MIHNKIEYKDAVPKKNGVGIKNNEINNLKIRSALF